MTKKEICLSNSAVAYYSGFDGLEAKCIEYGIKLFLTKLTEKPIAPFK